MSEEKWKEIERNLAEQESFVQTIMQQREKRVKPENNANIDNILSSSIQRAKQKINNIQSRTSNRERSSENLAASREKKERPEDSSGIAGAMKKLQTRISDLQKQKRNMVEDLNMERERREKLENKNNDLRAELEESKRKSKNLQITIHNDKSWIKELQKQIDDFKKDTKSVQGNEEDEELESKLSNWEMMFRAQEQELKNTLQENQNKEREFLKLRNQLQEEKIRFQEQKTLSKSIQKQLELKIANFNERLKQKDNLIEGLREEIKKSEMDKLKFSRALLDESGNEENCNRERQLREQTTLIKEDFEELNEKYMQLMSSYRNLEDRGQKDRNDAKNYRNKFWQLKEVLKQIIDKIQCLPNAITSQLRYLITKANKIEAFSNDYYVTTPTKSGRKNSLFNNSTSRSKSKSKSKQTLLKFEDLNQSNTSAKSKRSQKSNRSSSVKKSMTKSKEKKIVISQKSMKSEEVSKLQNEIQVIRRKYKELVMKQGKNGSDVGEEAREELNNLALLLQEKSECLTKIKRNK